MNLKIKGILLASQAYKIVDEKTQEITEGVSVQYIPSDDLSPCEDENLKGIRVSKEWLPIKLSQNITKVPAYYEFTMKSSTNTKGKSALTLKDLKFLTEINLNVKSQGA